jgi:hypothetical protein
MNNGREYWTDLPLCRYGKVLALVQDIHGSNLLALRQDCATKRTLQGAGFPVTIPEGVVFYPFWGNGGKSPHYKIQKNLDAALRGAVNTALSCQSRFGGISIQSDRFVFMFGRLRTPTEIAELRSKGRLRAAEQTSIIASVNDWIEALWCEREQAIASANLIRAGAEEVLRETQDWASFRTLCETAAPVFRCLPFTELGHLIAGKVITQQNPTMREETEALAEIHELCVSLLRSQKIEEVDACLSRSLSALKRSPRARRAEIVGAIESARAALNDVRPDYSRLTKASARIHGARWRLEIVRRGVERGNFERAKYHLEYVRERLVPLMHR